MAPSGSRTVAAASPLAWTTAFPSSGAGSCLIAKLRGVQAPAHPDSLVDTGASGGVATSVL